MQRTVSFLIFSFWVNTFSWAQDIQKKNWRLNEEGKLQHVLNESGKWETAECNVETRLSAFQFVTENDGWAVG